MIVVALDCLRRDPVLCRQGRVLLLLLLLLLEGWLAGVLAGMEGGVVGMEGGVVGMGVRLLGGGRRQRRRDGREGLQRGGAVGGLRVAEHLVARVEGVLAGVGIEAGHVVAHIGLAPHEHVGRNDAGARGGRRGASRVIILINQPSDIHDSGRSLRRGRCGEERAVLFVLLLLRHFFLLLLLVLMVRSMLLLLQMMPGRGCELRHYR